MIEEIRLKLFTYLHSLTIYDYVAFGWLLFLITIILVLIVLLARKKPKLAIWMTLLTLILIIAGPFGIKYFLDKSVRKVELLDTNITKLHYAQSLIITGKLKNSGKVKLQRCFISATVFQTFRNKYKNMLFRLKPLRKKTIFLEENLSKGDKKGFKIVIDHFNYSRDFNTTLHAECY